MRVTGYTDKVDFVGDNELLLPADRLGACCFLLGILLSKTFHRTFHAGIKIIGDRGRKPVQQNGYINRCKFLLLVLL